MSQSSRALVRSLTAALIVASAPSDALGQVRVAVSIDDSAAGNSFQGAFAAALRGLGDIAVVTEAESPDYVISGVVLCESNPCIGAQRYSASLRLWSPFRPGYGSVIAYRLVPRLPEATLLRRADSATAAIVAFMKGYEKTHQTWAVIWGREVYEQAIVSFVRKIDTECFEKDRISRRLALEADSIRRGALISGITSRKWMC